MPLQPGTRLAHYDVTSLLGEGGMGQVWQATDTQLGREVALKILPDAFAADPDRLARFKREAQILASLNHPNIAAIYGIEEAEGTRALVLELVEGPTLADRIKQGPIPLDEALPIAKQIAAALEAAHEQGVIHRDLKPANVKVKDDGTVKVLDFGLAKAFQPDAGDPGMSQSPTISLTAAATQMGMVMGTAAYMSPEQAKGKVIDRRADIWAFGAVLYEMLTGKRAFGGGDLSDTLAMVLMKEVDWSTLPADTPTSVRKLLERCLARDPKQRIRDIGDVSLAMEGAFETTVSTPSEAAVAPALQVWQRPVGGLGILGLAVLLTGLAVWSLTRPAPPSLARFPIPLTADQTLSFVGRSVVAISPDGTHVVYAGGNSLWLRPVAQLQAVQVPGTDAARVPFFSADGQSIGFWAAGQLKKVSVSGGPPVPLADARSTPSGASWGADEMILYDRPAGIMQVPDAGGTPRLLIPAEEGDRFWGPQMLPGGEWVLMTVRSTDQASWDEAQIVVQSVTTGERTVLVTGRGGRYLLTGHLVYVVNHVLFAVPFDVGSRAVTAGPVPLVEGVREGFGGAAQFSVSATGTLVYVVDAGVGASRTLVWVNRDGPEEPVTGLEPADYRSVDVSPDGSALAFEREAADGSDVWIYDLARGSRNPLTTDPAQDQTPLWTRDGRQVVFTSIRGGSWGLYRRQADGTGEAELLITDGDAQDLFAMTWTPEDTLVVGRRRNDQNELTLLSMEEEPALELLLESEFNETRADVSPDGGWIAYESGRSGRNEIYVERLPDLGDRQTISTDGGQQPRWSPDGRELFYLGPRASRLMVVPVMTETGLEIGTPETLVEGKVLDFRGRSSYDVAPDGRLVIIRLGAEASENDATPQINVVLNWRQELLERVPVP